MPKLSAIATALALLLHSLLGCCCHHAHAQTAENDRAAPHVCPCQHHSEPTGAPHDQAPSDPCDQGHCTLLASDNLAGTSLALHLTTSLTSALAAPLPPLRSLGAVAHLPSLSPPSPTLVELHQILQI